MNLSWGRVFHSALKHRNITPDISNQQVKSYTSNGCTAFVHDIKDGLPSLYSQCDVLYADVPWSRGMSVFNERAGKSCEYKDLMSSIADIISSSNVPVILTTSTQSLRYLPRPKYSFKTSIVGGESECIVYGADYEGPTHTADAILKHISSLYMHVGDFCCGYGRSAFMFHAASKHFTVSDYNESCISYIANEMLRIELGSKS